MTCETLDGNRRVRASLGVREWVALGTFLVLIMGVLIAITNVSYYNTRAIETIEKERTDLLRERMETSRSIAEMGADMRILKEQMTRVMDKLESSDR